VTLAVGATAALTATAYDAQGSVLTGRTVTWDDVRRAHRRVRDGLHHPRHRAGNRAGDGDGGRRVGRRRGDGAAAEADVAKS
jgi:hypothetical protein